MKDRIKFKKSSESVFSLDPNLIVSDALFVFTHLGHNGYRPHVVTRKKFHGMDCFEMDACSDGVRISGASEYTDWRQIKERSDANIDEFIYDRLYGYETGGTKGISMGYLTASIRRFIYRLLKSDIVQIMVTGLVTYWGYHIIKWFLK